MSECRGSEPEKSGKFIQENTGLQAKTNARLECHQLSSIFIIVKYAYAEY